MWSVLNRTNKNETRSLRTDRVLPFFLSVGTYMGVPKGVPWTPAGTTAGLGPIFTFIYESLGRLHMALCRPLCSGSTESPMTQRQRRSSVGLRGSSVDLRGPSVDLRWCSVGLRGPSVGMRGLSVGLRGPSVGMRGPYVGLRGPSTDRTGPECCKRALYRWVGQSKYR